MAALVAHADEPVALVGEGHGVGGAPEGNGTGDHGVGVPRCRHQAGYLVHALAYYRGGIAVEVVGIAGGVASGEAVGRGDVVSADEARQGIVGVAVAARGGEAVGGPHRPGDVTPVTGMAGIFVVGELFAEGRAAHGCRPRAYVIGVGSLQGGEAVALVSNESSHLVVAVADEGVWCGAVDAACGGEQAVGMVVGVVVNLGDGCMSRCPLANLKIIFLPRSLLLIYHVFCYDIYLVLHLRTDWFPDNHRESLLLYCLLTSPCIYIRISDDQESP